MDTVAVSSQQTEDQEFTTSGFNRDEVLGLLEKDLNFFAATVIPEVFRLAFPQIHKEIWELLREFVKKPKSFFKLALGLPRGHAKTTLIKLYVIYCILFTDRRFILIVGAAARMSENILADIMDMLRGENVKAIFGNWEASLEKDTEAVKKFTFAGRSIVLAALGAGSSLRGLNLRNDRPDVIICDDIQSAEDKDSKDVANKLLSWMLGTLFKAKSPNGCLYIYIGNMFSGPNCILAKLKGSKEWISFVVGALLADGNSIWPELHSPADLIAELQHDIDMGHPEIFFAEVQNDPDAGVSSTFDISKVPLYPFTENDLITGGCILIDLSGNKENSDDSTIGYFAFIEGRNVFKDLIFGNWSPLQCIEAAMALGYKHNCPYIFVESVAYQSSYLFWFNFICEQRGISGFQLFEVYPRSTKKVSRIIGFFKQLLNGDILLHPDVRTQVLYQASQFKPNKKDNVDDILDLGGYLDFVLSDYEPMLHNAVSEILASFSNEVKTTEECSTF